MVTEIEIRNIIEETIITSISSFSERSLKSKKKFQVLDLLIPKERKIRSIVGGLETSLGTTLWEPLAKSLAKSNGFNIIEDNLKMPTYMPPFLENTLTDIIMDRNTGRNNYSPEQSHDVIKEKCQRFLSYPITDFTDAPKGRGVDIWLEKDGINYLFDTKTVKPNVQKYKSLMEQVLYWNAFFYSKNPSGKVNAKIVFPYNPYEKDFWLATIGGGKPLEKGVEALVADEFWSLCTGIPGTYKLILNAFSSIRESKKLEEILHNLLYSEPPSLD